MAETNHFSNHAILKNFRSRITPLSGRSQSVYTRAIRSLELFLIARDLRIATLSLTDILDWAADQLRSGLAQKTVSQFLNVFNSVWNSAIKDRLLTDTDIIREARRLIADYNPADDIPVSDATFNRLVGLFRSATDSNPDKENAIPLDLLILSLSNGAMPLCETAVLKMGGGIQIIDNQEITKRNTSPRRKYLFNLRQSELTTRQLSKLVDREVAKILQPLFGQPIDRADRYIQAIWANIAMRCGATASTALGCLKDPLPGILPAFCLSALTDDTRRLTYCRAVADALTSNPIRWHAMHLRPKVKFEDVLKRIASPEFTGLRPEFFYPCESIRKRIGKKTVFENQPLISGIVFFRSRITDIPSLFRHIGDLAWCFRTFNSSSAPYAEIPDREMHQFQSAIGIFTPGTEICPLDTIQPRDGEPVIVIGGDWARRSGTFEGIGKNEYGSAIFKVKLTSNFGYEWRITIDPRLVKPVGNGVAR